MVEYTPRVRDFRAFWDNETRTRFANLLPSAMALLRLQPSDFDEFGSCKEYAILFFQDDSRVGGSAATYYRARKAEPSVKEDSLTALLYGIGRFHRENQKNSAESQTAELQLLGDLFDELVNFGQKIERAMPRHSVTPNSQQVPVRSTLGLLARLFRIDYNLEEEVAQRFFKDNGRFAYFDTYRFSADPGYIQKSFTVIIRGTDEFPAVTFRNFVDHVGSQRRSSGIVLPFSQQTAFFGHSDNGSFSKVMVFRNRLPQNLYRGLLISDEPDDDAVAARVLMKKSDVSDSRETNLGKVHPSDTDLTVDEVEGIRNKVPFVLEDPVKNEQGRTLDQDEIVQHIGSLMQNIEGRPRMTIKDGELFNPASDKFYTFNSALKRR